MKQTKAKIINLFTCLKRKGISDGMARDLIDTLWREIYWLYKEGHLRDPLLLELTPEELEVQFPELVYTRNVLEGTVNYSIMLGHGHQSNGDLSIILGGIGNISNDYKEVTMGGYATVGEGNRKKWESVDRLIVIGNGIDKDNRQNALVIYKSGYAVFKNAVAVGDYNHGGEGPGAGGYAIPPVEGTFRFTEELGPEVWWIDRWVPLTGKYYGGWDLVVDGINKGTVETDKFVEFERSPDIEVEYSDEGEGNKKLRFNLYGNEIITQEAHGFTGQHPIRRSEGIWIKAKADNDTNAQTMAFVSEIIDEDNFRIKSDGYLPGEWVDEVEYFLSPTTAGEAIEEPLAWNVGEVRQSLGWGKTPKGLKIEIDVGDLIGESAIFSNLVTGLSIAEDVFTLTQSGGEDVSTPFPYYTKTNLQTSGQAQVHFGNLTNKPTTISGYGITDAYTKTQLNTSGAGGQVHWNNVTNKPEYDNYGWWRVRAYNNGAGILNYLVGSQMQLAFTNGSGITLVGVSDGWSGSLYIHHADTSTQANISQSGLNVVQGLTFDTFGHVTGVSNTLLSVYTKSELNTSGAGGQVHWDNVTNKPAYNDYSHWNLYSNGTNRAGVISQRYVDFVGTAGVDVVYSDMGDFNKRLTFSHANTSSQASVNNSGNYAIQDITLDGFGHVTAITSVEISAGGSGTVTSVAAGAGMDFTTFSTSGTVVMGTPSNVTSSTINSASEATHTHAFSPAGNNTEVQFNASGVLSASQYFKYALSAMGHPTVYLSGPSGKNANISLNGVCIWGADGAAALSIDSTPYIFLVPSARLGLGTNSLNSSVYCGIKTSNNSSYSILLQLCNSSGGNIFDFNVDGSVRMLKGASPSGSGNYGTLYVDSSGDLYYRNGTAAGAKLN